MTLKWPFSSHVRVSKPCAIALSHEVSYRFFVVLLGVSVTILELVMKICPTNFEPFGKYGESISRLDCRFQTIKGASLRSSFYLSQFSREVQLTGSDGRRRHFNNRKLKIKTLKYVMHDHLRRSAVERSDTKQLWLVDRFCRFINAAYFVSIDWRNGHLVVGQK